LTDADPSDELRCLIVDDEAPARDELRHLLSETPGMRVLGAAATAEEAQALIAGLDYDIVFLDIHMPGMSGLELAAWLRDSERAPAVIFTTAYPDHALDAFELGAVDYLLKPFDTDRLQDSINKVLRTARDDSAQSKPGPQSASGGHSAPGGPEPAPAGGQRTDRIPVQRRDRTVFVDAGDIFYVTAARGYSYLKLADTQVLVNFTLTELEERLQGSFVRCHRSYLVNLDRVIEVRPDFKGGLVLRLNDTQQSTLPVSRRQTGPLRERLGL
jgi:DNA-binding LytR/AlgR family response regulator